jgi:hypothetical protein
LKKKTKIRKAWMVFTLEIITTKMLSIYKRVFWYLYFKILPIFQTQMHKQNTKVDKLFNGNNDGNTMCTTAYMLFNYPHVQKDCIIINQGFLQMKCKTDPNIYISAISWNKSKLETIAKKVDLKNSLLDYFGSCIVPIRVRGVKEKDSTLRFVYKRGNVTEVELWYLTKNCSVLLKNKASYTIANIKYVFCIELNESEFDVYNIELGCA